MLNAYGKTYWPLYDIAGIAYVYAGLPLLGILLCVLALWCRRGWLAIVQISNEADSV